MNLRKLSFSFYLFLFAILIGVNGISAQANSDKKTKSVYKINTYTIIGSNDDSEKSNLPKEIINSVDELKKTNSFSNYRNFSTSFQNIRDGGSISQSVILKEFGSIEGNNPVFADWNYQRFQLIEDTEGKETIKLNNFTFTINFPVKYNGVRDTKNGVTTSYVSYRPIRLFLQDVSIPVDKATVFASMPMKIKDETIFFIIKAERLD